ncbi:MAG: hypothetical protein Q9204_005406, partial [Flavoplaca sp. TL-2023a]
RAKNNPPYIEPELVYYGSYKHEKPPIQLRIATGGTGQSGLMRALADKFIDNRVKETGYKPFAVSWIKSDTAGSFNNLASGAADLSITYHPTAEAIAPQQGFTDRSVYAWRDHFMLVGQSSRSKSSTPNSFYSVSPNKIPQKDQGLILPDSKPYLQPASSTSSANSSAALSRTPPPSASYPATINPPPTSRSAHLDHDWSGPWAYPYSDLYHRYNSLPFQALAVAAKLGEYTVLDRGTW